MSSAPHTEPGTDRASAVHDSVASLRVPVTELLARPGAHRALRGSVPAPVLDAPAARIDADVDLDLVLEHVPEGIVVHGRVRAPWSGACSRCLVDVRGEVEVVLGELFERRPVEGETYPLENETVDLEPVLRDALLLELPAAPRCRTDCRGLCPQCGADRNEIDCDCATTTTDPRWAALDELRL